ncbi:unnamed protein product, partial [Coccothraustes coccothraustes]
MRESRGVQGAAAAAHAQCPAASCCNKRPVPQPGPRTFLGAAASCCNKRPCGRRGAQSPRRALHALPTPRCRAPSSPRRRRSLVRAAIAECGPEP